MVKDNGTHLGNAMILMDIQMPEMDGCEAIRRIKPTPRPRTSQSWPSAPIRCRASAPGRSRPVAPATSRKAIVPECCARLPPSTAPGSIAGSRCCASRRARSSRRSGRRRHRRGHPGAWPAAQAPCGRRGRGQPGPGSSSSRPTAAMRSRATVSAGRAPRGGAGAAAPRSRLNRPRADAVPPSRYSFGSPCRNGLQWGMACNGAR